ncbi:hypothetical protein GCM10010987_25910 [Bradyrhizobium guangdongense]|uniref:Uncharacterized protein n=1 Tax=Bradyrhizobium guangdongense TaxID=1325090 RepID=A0AA87W6R4_9BRAD|nr:hypothetical protein GCM10010987_25910 [Bradyrhizobium guangdongense]
MELVDRNPEPLGEQDVVLHAKGAAIDLGGAQLHKLEELLVETGFGRDLPQRQHQIIRIRRDPLEIFVFAAGM